MANSEDLQALRRLDLACPLPRNHAAAEAKAVNLRKPLTQVGDGPQLSGQPHLADGRHAAVQRLVPEAGGGGLNDRQVCCRLRQLQAANDIDIDVAAS